MKRFLSDSRAMKVLQAQCIERAVSITEPVALISQAGRSGGTLLSRLFDGHPECHAHPYEFRLGGYKDFNWPAVNPAERPVRLFERLFETVSVRLFRDGYSKGGMNESFPFYLLPNLQRAVFLDQLVKRGQPDIRDVFNAYMTSYFNAWVSNCNISGNKKIVTGFLPWALVDPASVENFFAAYPDGFIISIIREPKSWFASMKGYCKRTGREAEVVREVGAWVDTIQAAKRNKENYGSRVMLLRFEDLVGKTEKSMSRVCEFLGLSFLPSILEPTFNCVPVSPNTSLATTGDGVVKDPLHRARSLTPFEAESVDDRASRFYAEVLEMTEKIEGQ
jgi:hypothetical protein